MNHAILELAPGQLPEGAQPGQTVQLSVTAEVTDSANAVRVTEIKTVTAEKAKAEAAPAPAAKTTAPAAKTTKK